MGQMSDFDFKTHPSPVRDQIWVENLNATHIKPLTGQNP